tara:strand:- start:168 stop:332 length:165 start_codon:yes stop_codon:yes gene_type:complete
MGTKRLKKLVNKNSVAFKQLTKSWVSGSINKKAGRIFKNTSSKITNIRRRKNLL